jgi:hypothetical protein
VRDADTDRMVWKWSNASTLFGELGSPTSTTSYALCVYGGNTRLATLSAPAGSKWTQRSRGYRYADPTRMPSGIELLDLRAGTNARMLLKGKGPSLERPLLPVTQLPVRVQLVSSTGACWETALGSVRRNTDMTFLARE